MKCVKPLTLDNNLEVGCGQCMQCRINRQRMWVGRMILEAMDHPFSAFVTLTYDPEHVPEGGNLCKSDLQKFLKRLRKSLYPRKIRYYAVGEYGDQKMRPHYHLIIFGLSSTEGEIVRKCWVNGFSMTGTAEPSSMTYVGNYVLKKMTKKEDPRLCGRVPEFNLMSRGSKKNPIGGLGSGIARRAKEALEGRSEEYKKVVKPSLSVIRHEMRMFPLGKYLKEKIDACVKTDPLERREKLWRIITELTLQEFDDGFTVSERRKENARKASIALQKAKQSIVRRTL